MAHGGARAGFALLPAETPPAETERRRTWGWVVSFGHLSSDLIGSMSSPHRPFLSKKPIGSDERGRAQKPEWHSARHWSAYLSLASCD